MRFSRRKFLSGATRRGSPRIMSIYRSSRPFSAKVRFLRRMKKGGEVNYEISEQLEREKDRVSEATREKRNWLRRSPFGEKTAEVVDREIKKKKKGGGGRKKRKRDSECSEPRSAFRHLYPRDFSCALMHYVGSSHQRFIRVSAKTPNYKNNGERFEPLKRHFSVPTEMSHLRFEINTISR